ncbi:MAG TPA: rod shape-determining protein MreC [Chitinispirillaceae bacterium]|jgi:rod shape-determining protein MreC|nr:rod shape-determining protein MreC [Chitinispirillaceae bacterium]
MHWIFDFIVKHRSFCSFLLTSILSLWMISGTPGKQAEIVRFLTSSIFYPFQITFNQINQIKNIFSENRKLKEDLANLTTHLALLEEKAAENKRLRRLLGFSENYTYEMLPVKVVARDPSLAFRSIVINAGTKDSIQKWMPVVGENGVVGKIIQVMNSLSLVQLLRDPSNRTSVMFKRTRTVSILETENGRDFFVRCRSHEDTQEGDTVITAGLGGIYPRGLQVGVVSHVTESNSPLFKRVYLKLSVDFEHIEEVFIMRLSPQWSAFRSEFDSLEFNND